VHLDGSDIIPGVEPRARYRERAPDAALRRHVTCLWAVDDVDGRRRVLPDGCVDLVFGRQGVQLVGPMTRPLAVVGGGFATGVRLRPGAARLLGLPAGELVDLRVDADAAWGAAGRRLAERLAACTTPDQAAAVLTDTLARRLDEAPPLDPVVLRAVSEIEGARGVDVARLGRELYLSERQLRRRFVRDVGIGPAAFARVTRLQRLLRLAADARPGTTVARLAADAGYADEPHLAHDARALTGLAPRALIDDHGLAVVTGPGRAAPRSSRAA